MRLIHAWHGNDGKPVKNANGDDRHQVRWKLDPGGGRKPIERKRSNFHTKGEAQTFVKQLRRVEFDAGWIFDSEGQPVEATFASPTVLAAVLEYIVSRWTTVWQPGQRTKVVGRLKQLVAITVTRPSDRKALLEALAAQAKNRGRRPVPSTTIEWAARWLHDVAFYPPNNVAAPVDAAEAEGLQAGQRWLAAASMQLSALDVAETTRLRLHFTENHPYGTARTYWQGTIVPWLNWLQETGKVDRYMSAGQPKLTRDVVGERPDPRDIPNLDELHLIATAMGKARGRHRRRWELFVLLAGFCSLRISAALAVRLDDFELDDKGRWWLNSRTQVQHIVAASSDDGATTFIETEHKSTRQRTPPLRRIPIPKSLADRLVADYGDQLGVVDTRLFTGPRGGVGQDETVRTWWHKAVRDALGSDHRLANINPHALRHAGMTYWFAVGCDDKRIQEWGGWQSVKEMQDTYRGVLKHLEVQDLNKIDTFAAGTDPDAIDPVERDIELDALDTFVAEIEPTTDALPASHHRTTNGADDDSASASNVVSLDTFRDRRRGPYRTEG